MEKREIPYTFNICRHPEKSISFKGMKAYNVITVEAVSEETKVDEKYDTIDIEILRTKDSVKVLQSLPMDIEGTRFFWECLKSGNSLYKDILIANLCKKLGIY